MPGNLLSASVSPTSTVFPFSLCTSFTETTAYPILSVEYHDGSIERSLITDTVNPARQLRTWQLSKRLTAAKLSTLLAFFESLSGGYKPFYFYDPYEAGGGAVGSNYDSSGASTQGRVVCVFRGNWSHTTGLGRADVQGLTLQEIA